VVLKDVVDRYHISDVMMLESVLSFVLDNIGSLVSTTKKS
jgi:predicted AAA+ superfamily ATPase